MKLAKYLIPVLAMAVVVPAFAADEQAAPAAAATSTTEAPSVWSKFRAGTDIWWIGPTSKDIDGRAIGRGPDMQIRYYPSIGYKITPKMTVRAAIEGRQFIRPKDLEDPTRKDFVLVDPYVTLSHSALLESEKFASSLAGSLRYYVPSSRPTHDGIGGRNDRGNGMVRVGLVPSKSFLDGDLTISSANYLYYRFAQEKHPNHTNYEMLFVPSVAYTVSPKLEVAVEYATGYIRHSKATGVNHNLSRLNAQDGLGQWISPSITYTPNKYVSFNPAISWSRAKTGPEQDNYSGANFRLDTFDILLMTTVTLL